MCGIDLLFQEFDKAIIVEERKIFGETCFKKY
jgi:hypothetical protein